MIKHPKIVQRTPSEPVYSLAKTLGLTDFQAKLVANRTDQTDQLDEIVFPKLKHIQHPSALKNIDLAAEIIVDAIQSNGLIVLATDYDTDGVTSAWVATTALCDYFSVPKSRIKHIIGDRKTGYGINENVVERILSINEPIDLVISADQGSSDEERIAKLKSHNIDVCVTDHHQIPQSGVPKSAVCTVNPQQEGCQYDKTVAGCFVIFLVMTQVRQALIKNGFLSAKSPSLKYLALNVALGTVADSVSLKSPNNRAIVHAGLQLINMFQSPAWQAVRELNDNQGLPIDAEFLGFQVATRINAASRVSDVNTAFNFLTANNLLEASAYLQQLDEDNQNRRTQQETMLQQAQQQAQQKYHDDTYSMTLKLNGNAGIQGIIASRIGEQYGVPTVAMTDLEDGNLAGSARGVVPNIDLREAFQWMSDQKEDLFISMGGHKGAAGCMIPINFFDVFSDLFEQAVKLQLGDEAPVPIIETDGELSASELHIDTARMLSDAGPWGQAFPEPTFDGRFQLMDQRIVGEKHLKMVLQPHVTSLVVEAIAFFVDPKEWPDRQCHEIIAAYRMDVNRYCGQSKLQLIVEYFEKK